MAEYGACARAVRVVGVLMPIHCPLLLRALRASLPRGERAARLAEAVKGFAVEARLVFPAWFEAGIAPPPAPGSGGDP